MSNLPGNPHMDDAMTYSCAASEIMAHDEQERALYAQQATTHAILVLAYEQRTANLIAVATAVSENGVYQLNPALIGAAQEELATRLGLGATK